MQATKNVIVKMAKLPVSIVIVGLGDEDFDEMQTLDADQVILTNDKGQPAVRDIVQFVDYKDFLELALTEVTDELLKEIPDQFVEYMVMKRIKPDDPFDFSEEAIKD